MPPSGAQKWLFGRTRNPPMKSYKHLYPAVCEWDNLDLAYRKARLGKRSRPPAAAFEYDLEANLVELRRELADRTYQPPAMLRVIAR